MKEMHSWRPRQPSERVARRLFGPAAARPAKVRRTEWQGWLTPAAACALTMLLAVGSMTRHAAALAGRDDATFFAAVMLDPGSSNTEQIVRLSQSDENVQWNVWPELTPPGRSTPLSKVQKAGATNSAL